MAHGQYLEGSAWVGEVALYAGLLVAAVVGLRGGFRGGRATGIMALVGTVAAFIGFSRLGMVFASPFLVVGAIHILIATFGFVRRGSKTLSAPKAMVQEAQLAGAGQESQPMKKTPLSRTGWWIAGILEKQPDSSRAPYWNNYRLVRADDWRTAFRRATEMGENDARAGDKAFSGRHEFIGITDLLPIYDELEDGAELLWQELDSSEDSANGIPLTVFTEADLEAEYENRAKQDIHPNA